jgi:hypothetical protein
MATPVHALRPACKAARIICEPDRDTETENAAGSSRSSAIEDKIEAILDRPEGDLVQVRYLGFDQRQNSRVYRFDVRAEGMLKKQVSITADVAVFRDHSVGMQEGPFLSGNKLTADLERGWEGDHELTAADVRAYADTKALAAAQRAATRKTPRRPAEVPAEAQQKSPWRNFGV